MYKVTFIISDEEMIKLLESVNIVSVSRCLFPFDEEKVIRETIQFSFYEFNKKEFDFKEIDTVVNFYSNRRVKRLYGNEGRIFINKMQVLLLFLMKNAGIHISSMHSKIEGIDKHFEKALYNMQRKEVPVDFVSIALDMRTVFLNSCEEIHSQTKGPMAAEPEPEPEDAPSIAKNAKQYVNSYIDKLVGKYNEVKKELTLKDSKIASLEEKVKELTLPKLTKKEELSNAFNFVATEAMNTNRGKPLKTRTEVSNALNVIEKRIKIDIDEGIADAIDNYDADENPPKIEIKELVLNKRVDKEANVSNGGIGFKTENKE